MKLFCVSVLVLFVSCSSNQDQLLINEIYFNQDDINVIEGVELFNPAKNSIGIKNVSVILNDTTFPIEGLSKIGGEDFAIYKLHKKINNQEFSIALKIDGELVSEINWKGTKKCGYLGRLPDGGTVYRLTTRSIANTNEKCGVKIKSPKFNVKSGLYDTEQTLELNREYEGTQMYFTVDGSEPGTMSMKYEDKIVVEENTVIKAKYIHEGFSSNTSVTTILIGENTKLPVVSIAVDGVGLWDEKDGLMHKGLLAEEKSPYKGANYWQKTKLKSNIQYFDEDKKMILDETAILKIHGNYSRTLPMKGLRLVADNKSGKFKFKPYQNRERDSFTELILRAGGQDMGQGHFRDAFVHNYLGPRLNLDYQAAQPIVIFINGAYYGVGHLREVINKQYLEHYFGKSNEYNLLKLWGVAMIGKDKDYLKTRKMLEKGEISNQEKIEQVLPHFDFDNWMDYFIVESYSANLDWFPNNAKFWCKRYDKNYMWRYLLNDLDAGFGRPRDSLFTHDMFEFLFTECYNKEFKVFMTDPKLMEHFVLRYADLLNTTLHPDTISYYAKKYQAMIEPEMPRLFKKYTWEKSLKKWKEYELPKLYSFFDNRPKYVRDQMNNHLNLGGTYQVKIKSSGNYHINTIDVKGDFEGLYFAKFGGKIVVDKTKYPRFSHFVINGKRVQSNALSFKGKPNDVINIEIVFN